MMWHERQNAVLSERCISFSMPATMEKSGRKKSTPKARIFPARLTVIAGRTTKTPASAALNSTRITIANVGIGPKSSYSLLFFQGTNVGDEILDLVRFQAFAVRWHLALAVADDSGDHIVGLRLHICGTEIPDVIRFAHGSLALPSAP